MVTELAPGRPDLRRRGRAPADPATLDHRTETPVIDGRELAMAVLNLRGRPADAIVRAGAAAGFDSVTLRVIEPKDGDHGQLVYDASARRSVRQLMDDLGISLLDVEVVRLRPKMRLDLLLPALDAVAELGARHVLTVCEDPDAERSVSALVAFARECTARGMRSVLEFMRFSECRSFEQAMRLAMLARVEGADDVGVLVDALHLERSGGTVDQVAVYAADFPEMFPYVQMCDAPLLPPHGGVNEIRDEAVFRRLLPGDGELPLEQLLAALPPGIPVCIETPVAALVSRPDGERAAAAFDAGRRLLHRASRPIDATRPEEATTS
jgi:sugar phosphate isomerase/epimerase